MLYQKVFRTAHVAQARARYETEHCNERYRFDAVRFVDGERDTGIFESDTYLAGRYTWRIERTSRLELARERDASRSRYASVLFRRRA